MTIAVFLSIVALVPAVATARPPVDNYVSTLIEGRDYGAAEDALHAKLARIHGDPAALLNLAFLYRSTDRFDQARSVYAAVLSGRDAKVQTNVGTVASVHDIARAALGVGTVTVASR